MKPQFINHLLDHFEPDVSENNPLAACLKIAVNQLGLSVKWNEIEHLSELNADNLNSYERQIGMMIYPLALSSGTELSHTLYPILMELNEPNGFRVLVKNKWGKNRLYNPMTHQYESLERNFSVLQIARSWQCCPVDFPLTTANSTSGLFKSIFNYFRKEIFNAVGLGTIVAATALMISIVSSYIFGHLHEMHQSGHAIILISFFLFMMGCSLLSCVNDLYIKTLNFKVLSIILPSTWHHILNMPMKHSKKFVSGEMIQKIMDYEMAISSIVTNSLAVLFDSMVLIFLLGYMVYCNAALACLYLLICLIFSGFKLSLLPKDIQYLTLQLVQKAKLSTLLNEVLLQIHKCRSSHVEKEVIQKWLHNVVNEKGHEEKSVRLELLSLALEALMPLLLMLSFYFWLYIQSNTLDALILLPFMVCAGQFMGSFEKLSAGVLSLTHLLPALKRLQPLLNEPVETYEDTNPGFTLKGDITVSHLNWLNPETRKPILEDICIEIKAGQFIALIGASGSGKTSILRLLLGFESPNAGSILFDGINMKNLNMQNIRKQFGVVLQTTNLFAGNIFSNIAANTNITLDEAWELSSYVGLSDEIKAMPMKMHTHLSDNVGESISGGQKQKILIARALATSPKVLLLDEATSALDNESQLLIHQKLKTMNVTRLVIAHRYSTIREADMIYVIDQGCVICKGTYDEISSGEK